MTDNNTEIEMADDSKTGITIMMGILSLIMGVMGIVLHYLFQILFFEDIMAAEIAAGNPCVVSAPIFFPLFAYWYCGRTIMDISWYCIFAKEEMGLYSCRIWSSFFIKS